MPKDIEIISQIKYAEQKARDIRANADKTAKENFEAAKLKIKQETEQLISECRKKNKEMIERAKNKASEQIDAVRIAAYENAAAATKISEKRMEKAVSAVINAVLCGGEKK